ncbi:3919_t:CDS:2, partial [Dentiscutata erythropus]
MQEIPEFILLEEEIPEFVRLEGESSQKMGEGFEVLCICFRFRSYFSVAQREERNALLKKIYTPSFSKLEKGTKGYLDFAKSGKVWENHICPFEWNEQDY